MSRYRSLLAYNQLLVAHIMSKIFFMKYLPAVRPKMVPKLKMLRIYWNLEYLIFDTCDILNIQISILMSKLVLLNTYYLLDPKWSQNKNCSGFIELWCVWYFEYPDLNFDVKKFFFIKYLPSAWPKLISKWKMLRIYWNLIKNEVW